MWYMFSSSLYWLIIGNQCEMGKAFYCVTGIVCFLLTEEYQFKRNINGYKQSIPQIGLYLQCDCTITFCTFCCYSNANILLQTVAVLGSGMNCLWFAADTLKTQTSHPHPAHCSEDRLLHLPHKELCLGLCDVISSCTEHVKCYGPL